MGWLQVRQQGGQNNELKPEYLQELNEREMKAQTEGFGIWNKVICTELSICLCEEPADNGCFGFRFHFLLVWAVLAFPWRCSRCGFSQ